MFDRTDRPPPDQPLSCSFWMFHSFSRYGPGPSARPGAIDTLAARCACAHVVLTGTGHDRRVRRLLPLIGLLLVGTLLAACSDDGLTSGDERVEPAEQASPAGAEADRTDDKCEPGTEVEAIEQRDVAYTCLLYTSDAADE